MIPDAPPERLVITFDRIGEEPILAGGVYFDGEPAGTCQMFGPNLGCSATIVFEAGAERAILSARAAARAACGEASGDHGSSQPRGARGGEGGE